MTQGFSRRSFLGGSAGFVAGSLVLPGWAGAPETSLRPKARADDFRKAVLPPAEALLEKAGLNGNTSFAVMRATTGETLESHDPELSLPPASVAKALTAGYALDVLGPGYRFVTRVVASGPIRDGVLDGDLVLAGGGDPTLDSDALADLAGAVRQAGVTKVTGGLKVWGGALPMLTGIDPDQPEHVGYNPSVSGMNLNYNRVHFEWRKAGGGYAVTMQARAAAHTPDVRVAQMALADRIVPVYTYEDAGGRDKWTVAQGALGDGGARWLPVRKPEVYAGEVFQTLLRANGITVGAPGLATAAPEGTELARRESVSLRIILRDMLKWSTNLTAEVVGLTATAKRTGKVPASLEESAAEMNAWAQQALGVPGMALVDHSGLGDRSRVTAGQMTGALRALRQSMGIKALLKPIPLRDDDYRVVEDHPVSVHAKTGTLNFVSGLAGFIDLPDGTELVFAIFSADLPRRDKLTRDQRERPDGGREWNSRAKVLQQALIERWSVLYHS
ncbi:D-alanyl-D-alanine carboxypeptidase/D-alanyl-D-alanine endopeptidase [Maliponia aquimaris]|uniref:D-alanyl-D-alanine carboxypeptidase DacC n=1 Tax=Maliponia aquimaris TaxID=1673631 RepID=A0A238K630_9RHOB|nr:D-alanyl-D-alanine carboxypeptidase/D-alanyl-D-alanine-endopeptidase [Maliponia aquimaris]SMX38285.1 D-alanyl-D-alanine carboxypeptidase DacC precursor [Maliponia aquimaris]